MKYSFSKNIKWSCAAAVAFVLSLVSCQKEIHVNLGTSPTQIVVQGTVETNLPPFVILTSTISFFSEVNLSTLQNSFIHGASIQVADGSNTVTLKEYTIDTAGGNKFYFYSIDTAHLASAMLGQVGKFYTLTITYNGTTYTSVTKIPAPKGPDSVYFSKPISGNTGIPTSAQQLFANYTDPDTLGNYVRYFTQRNKEAFYPSGIFSDELVNGTVVNNIALYAGYDDSTNVNADSLRYFYPGDSVTLKWSEMDKGVYTFWNSYNFASNAIGNPFASPINLISNVSNGALGVWAGYGDVLITRVLPH